MKLPTYLISMSLRVLEPMTSMTKPHHLTLSAANPNPSTVRLTLSVHLSFGLRTDDFPSGLLVAPLNPVQSFSNQANFYNVRAVVTFMNFGMVSYPPLWMELTKIF